MINLNKIDPRIMQIVISKTSNHNVHKKDTDPSVDKDGRHRHEGNRDIEDIRRKVKYANRKFKENEIDIFLVLNEELLGVKIEVLVYEASTEKLLAIINEERLFDLLEELDMKSGIILDMKG